MDPSRRAAELVGRIKAGKAAIRRHRSEVAAAKDELVAIERECAHRGIKLLIHGEGKGTHGHQAADS